jgi:hypothetical protein
MTKNTLALICLTINGVGFMTVSIFFLSHLQLGLGVSCAFMALINFIAVGFIGEG